MFSILLKLSFCIFPSAYRFVLSGLTVLILVLSFNLVLIVPEEAKPNGNIIAELLARTEEV